MKALKTLALLLGLTLTLSACGLITSPDGPTEVITGGSPQQSEPQDTQPEEIGETGIRIGALKGPTAMGMILMISDDGVNSYTLAGSADELTPSFIKGDLDIICVPANLAAVLYNKTECGIVALAVNTLGVLYIVENNGETIQSMADLRGKTIVAAGKGSTPEYGLRYLLEQNGLDPDKDVTVDWKSEHAECVAALAAGTADIALLPQPFVTVAQSKLENLRVALDLTAEWDALETGYLGSTMITGVAVARRAFVEENPELVDRFLEEYAASVDWVNANTADAAELIAEHGIIDSAAIAEKALPYCNIVCIRGAEMEQKLAGYLQTLYDAAPASVGGWLPGHEFFYGG